jgi:hypothetical protein
MFQRMGEAFGIPVGWFAAGIVFAHAFPNYLKTLAPYMIASNWFPLVAFLASAGYSFATLRPSWVAVIVGAVIIFAVQWLAWLAAKKAAIKAGARPE